MSYNYKHTLNERERLTTVIPLHTMLLKMRGFQS